MIISQIYLALALSVGTPAATADAYALGSPDCKAAPSLTPAQFLGGGAPQSSFYPPLSNLLGEQGSATASFFVDETGKISNLKITESSGYSRLDDATLTMLGSKLYKPAMFNGKPIGCPKTMRVVWKFPSDRTIGTGALNVEEMGEADYPAQAKANHEQGVTVLFVAIDESGAITNAAVVQTSGFPDLDAAAIAHAYAAHDMAPAKINGKPVKSLLAIAVNWALHDAPVQPH
jgi:TonB family protein